MQINKTISSSQQPENSIGKIVNSEDSASPFEYIPACIGIDLGKYDGSDVFQFNKDRFCHTLIVGRTGSGKSNLVHQMERSDILSGAGVAIMATHVEDALYPLSCVPPERQNDVVVIDATDEEYLPCLNPLGIDTDNQVEIQHAIESTLELLKSGSETSWTGPRFDSLMRAALGLIMSVPPKHCKPFIGQIQDVLTDPEEVKSRLKYVTQKSIYDFWTREYPAMQRSQDAGEVNNWALAKITAFINNHTLAPMFGPGSKTIDFRDIVNNGKILVVLAPATHIGEEPARIIRTWVFMELFNAIMSRGDSTEGRGLIRSKRNPEFLDPFFIYADEFGEIASDGFSRMLSQVRKRNVGMILSLQNLEQLRAFNPRLGCKTSSLLDSVLANAGTVIAYQLGISDAEILAKRFEVESNKLQEIRQYRPKAIVRLDGQECGPLDLDIPLEPKPENTSNPSRFIDSLINREVLLRVNMTEYGYQLNSSSNPTNKKPEDRKFDAAGKDCSNDDGNNGITSMRRNLKQPKIKHYLDEDKPAKKAADLYLFDDLEISERWANKFDEGGISTVADLIGYSEESLRNINGIGSKAIDELKAGLAKYNLLHIIRGINSNAA